MEIKLYNFNFRYSFYEYNSSYLLQFYREYQYRYGFPKWANWKWEFIPTKMDYCNCSCFFNCGIIVINYRTSFKRKWVCLEAEKIQHYHFIKGILQIVKLLQVLQILSKFQSKHLVFILNQFQIQGLLIIPWKVLLTQDYYPLPHTKKW